jgi:hypothetical protein
MNFSKRKNKVSPLSLLILIFVIVCLLITSFVGPAVNAQSVPSNNSEAIPLTQAMIEQSIEDTLDELAEVYIYPEKVPDIRAKIMHNLSNGAYTAIPNNIEFAQVIGSELREISGDQHLGILINPRDGQSLTPVLPAATEMVKHNFAFQKVEILGGNIGLLKFNKFDSDPDSQMVVDHAIGFLARTDALIIDLRDCIGGSPQLVRYLVSHFLQQETHLWTAVNQGEEQHPVISLRDSGPRRFKENYPVFILTSQSTTSAAEVFTFILQQLHKATVVGEQTRGITHQVASFAINDYFIGRFSTMWLQFSFAQDGIEGLGVTPDVETSPETSLEIARNKAMALLNR